jgi:drug/metabolite transporter (DMT)-like permease
LVTSTPINVTLVASSLPAWMLAVGTMFFGERPTRRQLLGAACGLAGVLLVIGRGSWQTLLAVRFVAGDLVMIAAVVGWAFYSWLLARPSASMRGALRPGSDDGWDWAGMLLLQAVLGGAMAGLLAGGEQLAGAAPIRWSWPVIAALAFVAIGPSIVAYRCWGLGVATAGPALAAFFGNLTPLMTALLSAWVLGEAPRAYHALAFALIVGGIALGSARPGPPARTGEAGG